MALTPVNDPDTENFKVRLAGNRDLMAHVVRTPDNTNASGVTVQFFTNLGSVNGSGGSSTGVTDASGTVGVRLWGGWEPGMATVRARVTANGTNYDDVALVPVVAPDGEDTGIGPLESSQSNFYAVLTPPASDVKFEGLNVTERNGGNGFDWCDFWWKKQNGITQAQPYPFLSGSSGGWGVNANNRWEYDHVIWELAPQYYRDRIPDHIPCECGVTQHIDVVRPIDINGDGLTFGESPHNPLRPKQKTNDPNKCVCGNAWPCTVVRCDCGHNLAWGHPIDNLYYTSNSSPLSARVEENRFLHI